jgi:hypothetical protein
MLARPILSAEVKGHPASRSLRIVSLADFRTGPWQMIDRLQGNDVLPYCLDVKERRSLYCHAGSVREAQRAPFYYLHLRQRATTLFAIPWEHGRVLERGAATPCFIFSVGRCGSTLLVDALRAGGACAVSEPDFFTQAVATSLFEGPLYSGYAELARALRDVTGDLLAAVSKPSEQRAFIKLRAQCCKAPRLIVGENGGKSIFLIRQFPAWAASTVRVSTISARGLVDRYIEGLRALQWLQRNTDCHFITYENLTTHTEGSLQDLKTTFGLTRTLGIAQADSQRGTPLSRKAARDEDGRAQLLHRAERLWREERPAELLRHLRLADYC